MNEELAIQDNEFLRQFEYKKDGALAKIEYSMQERKVFLTKLVLPESLDDKAFEEQFITAVLKHIEGNRQHVVPTSPKIAGFLRRHKEFKELLPVGVRI